MWLSVFLYSSDKGCSEYMKLPVKEYYFFFQEYAETAMNELLGWYGYDKVDSRDTKGLNLHHFAASRMSSGRRSPSDADSSDVEGARSNSSPCRRDGSSQGSPPLPGIYNEYDRLVQYTSQLWVVR